MRRAAPPSYPEVGEGPYPQDDDFRAHLNPQDQEIFDAMVRDEMAKMEQQFRDQIRHDDMLISGAPQSGRRSEPYPGPESGRYPPQYEIGNDQRYDSYERPMPTSRQPQPQMGYRHDDSGHQNYGYDGYVDTVPNSGRQVTFAEPPKYAQDAGQYNQGYQEDFGNRVNNQLDQVSLMLGDMKINPNQAKVDRKKHQKDYYMKLQEDIKLKQAINPPGSHEQRRRRESLEEAPTAQVPSRQPKVDVKKEEERRRKEEYRRLLDEQRNEAAKLKEKEKAIENIPIYNGDFVVKDKQAAPPSIDPRNGNRNDNRFDNRRDDPHSDPRRQPPNFANNNSNNDYGNHGNNANNYNRNNNHAAANIPQQDERMYRDNRAPQPPPYDDQQAPRRPYREPVYEEPRYEPQGYDRPGNDMQNYHHEDLQQYGHQQSRNVEFHPDDSYHRQMSHPDDGYQRQIKQYPHPVDRQFDDRRDVPREHEYPRRGRSEYDDNRYPPDNNNAPPPMIDPMVEPGRGQSIGNNTSPSKARSRMINDVFASDALGVKAPVSIGNANSDAERKKEEQRRQREEYRRILDMQLQEKEASKKKLEENFKKPIYNGEFPKKNDGQVKPTNTNDQIQRSPPRRTNNHQYEDDRERDKDREGIRDPYVYEDEQPGMYRDDERNRYVDERQDHRGYENYRDDRRNDDYPPQEYQHYNGAPPAQQQHQHQQQNLKPQHSSPNSPGKARSRLISDVFGSDVLSTAPPSSNYIADEEIRKEKERRRKEEYKRLLDAQRLEDLKRKEIEESKKKELDEKAEKKTQKSDEDAANVKGNSPPRKVKPAPPVPPMQEQIYDNERDQYTSNANAEESYSGRRDEQQYDSSPPRQARPPPKVNPVRRAPPIPENNDDMENSDFSHMRSPKTLRNDRGRGGAVPMAQVRESFYDGNDFSNIRESIMEERQNSYSDFRAMRNQQAEFDSRSRVSGKRPDTAEMADDYLSDWQSRNRKSLETFASVPAAYADRQFKGQFPVMESMENLNGDASFVSESRFIPANAPSFDSFLNDLGVSKSRLDKKPPRNQREFSAFSESQSLEKSMVGESVMIMPTSEQLQRVPSAGPVRSNNLFSPEKKKMGHMEAAKGNFDVNAFLERQNKSRGLNTPQDVHQNFNSQPNSRPSSRGDYEQVAKHLDLDTSLSSTGSIQKQRPLSGSKTPSQMRPLSVSNTLQTSGLASIQVVDDLRVPTSNQELRGSKSNFVDNGSEDEIIVLPKSRPSSGASTNSKSKADIIRGNDAFSSSQSLRPHSTHSNNSQTHRHDYNESYLSNDLDYSISNQLAGLNLEQSGVGLTDDSTLNMELSVTGAGNDDFLSNMSRHSSRPPSSNSQTGNGSSHGNRKKWNNSSKAKEEIMMQLQQKSQNTDDYDYDNDFEHESPLGLSHSRGQIAASLNDDTFVDEAHMYAHEQDPNEYSNEFDS